MNYVTLKKGDMIQPGDEVQDQFTGKWHPTKCAGRGVGIPCITSGRYRRAIFSPRSDVGQPAQPAREVQGGEKPISQ